MVFSSILFLTLFLPVSLVLCLLAPRPWRNLAALLASLVFYAWGAPKFVYVLVATSAFDFVAGRHLPPIGDRPTRRAWLAAAVALNLALLLYFKYANFLVAQANAVLLACGVGSVAWTKIALPIGISFFTFQKISYLVDVYRGAAPPARSFGRYLLYVVLFPQLIAGPIVRYHDIARQLDERTVDAERILSGIWRFCLGLAKKVLIANVVAVPADWAFGVAPAQLGAAGAWLGVVCYAAQIYFDFSAYSDMAIGLGRILGFEFLENFDAPYISASITEFWRRWHISLSTWMREYVYIPLGGNRLGPARTYLNLWITFLVSGIWHGAAWNFVVWGAYHGALLSAHRWMRRVGLRSVPAALARPATFLCVLGGWVFFRMGMADRSVGESLTYLSAMFGGGAPTAEVAEALAAHLRDRVLLTTLAAAACATVAPLLGMPAAWRDARVADDAPFAAPRLLARTVVAGVVFLACLCALASGRFNPFIYYRF